jgi:hypothetical protein
MLNISIQSVVNQIVRSKLLRNCGANIAIAFNFDCRLSYHTDDKSYNQSRGLHLLYHSLGTYVDVFTSVTDSPFSSIKEVKEWKHIMSHDSCWSDVNVFSNIYFDMANCINNDLAKDGLSAVAPIQMSEHNNFAMFGDLYKWVPVKISKDKNDKNNYRKIVELV